MVRRCVFQFKFLRGGSNADPGNFLGSRIAATLFVFLFTAIFGATWLTVPWLYPAEIFPLEIRAKGNAWGVVGWSIGNGWLVRVSLPAVSSRLFRSGRELLIINPSSGSCLCATTNHL